MTNSNSSGRINPFTGQPLQIGVDSAGRYTKPRKSPEKPADKDTDKDKEKKKTNNPKTVAALKAAATAVAQFRENRKVDYSGINSSTTGSAQETDLTAPGYSDYFARDNKGPV